MEIQPMMCLEEDLIISATSMCLVVLCTFTLIETTWESLMKRLMMDSSCYFLSSISLSIQEHLRYSTSEDKKWKKPFMLPSVKIMKQFPNPAQRVMKSTSMKIDPSLKMNSLFQGTSNKLDDFELVEDIELAKEQVSTIIEPNSNTESLPTFIQPTTEVSINPHVSQDRWSREKHIELVNILGEPQAGVTVGSIIKDSDDAQP
ncbi:hypothetical protein Tco_0432326 [Tanacetum coccineum]